MRKWIIILGVLVGLIILLLIKSDSRWEMEVVNGKWAIVGKNSPAPAKAFL